ncbi:hypothetical protein NKH77_13580 [Streptomyces sp. M19]
MVKATYKGDIAAGVPVTATMVTSGENPRRTTRGRTSPTPRARRSAP